MVFAKSLQSYPRCRSGGGRKGTGIALAFGAFALASASAPLFADQSAVKGDDGDPALQEVVVTAQKVRQNIQNVPITMSALTADSIKLTGMVGFHQWGDSMPGIQVAQGGDANRRAGPTATIRGVAQSNAGQESEVSAMATTNYTFGEVPINSGDPALFDMNRIEALRGPQGALFGLASMGGTIRFIPNDADTHAFSAEFDGSGGIVYHGGTQHQFQAMLNAPIIENVLALRIAAETLHQDGFVTVHILPLSLNDPKQIVLNNGASGLQPAPIGQGDISDANDNTLSAARVSLTYTPTDKLSIRAFAMIQAQKQPQKENIDYNAGGWQLYRYMLEPQDNDFRIFSLDTQYQMGFGSLHYVFGSQYRSQTESNDFTNDAVALLSTAKVNALQVNPALPKDPLPGPVLFPFFSQNKSTSNELRLQGSHEPLFGDLTFDYIVGLFHMTENASGNWNVADPSWDVDKGPNTEPILTRGGLILGQDGWGKFKTSAVFSDLTLNVGPKLSIGGGARFSRDEFSSAEFTYGDLSSGLAINGATAGDNLNGPGKPSMVGTIRQNSVTPRGIVSFQIDPDRMLYFDAAKGQRIPESLPNPKYWQNPGSANPECQALAKQLGVYDAAVNGTKSDTVWSYDLGLKSSWLDHRLILDPAIYDVRWSGMQLNVHLNQVTDACNNIINANVGDVESKGVEFAGKYAPVDSLVLSASFAYDKIGLSQDVTGVTSSLGTPLKKGDTVTAAPEWQGNASIEYTFPAPYLAAHGSSGAHGYIYADWRYVGERFDAVLGNKEALRQKMPFFVAEPYSLADVRLGVMTGGWTASVFCTNLFDKRAMYSSYEESWFPNQRLVSVSQPRTVGVDFTLYF
jgi:outer membrane receptor protein involved in Fe transport